jgi:transcriptional regulator with XRE-family HTH domain
VVDAGPVRRTLPPHLAAGIDEARRRRGWSTRQLAQAAGISKSMAAYLCTGERLPSRQVAWAVIDALDLDDDLAEALLDVAAERAWR